MAEVGVENRMLRLPELSNRVGLGRTKIYEMIKEGEFPRPIKAGRASLWHSQAIEKWMQGQAAVHEC